MADIDTHEDALLSRREMLEKTGKVAVGGALAIALGGLTTTGNAGVAEAATKTKYVAKAKITGIGVRAFSNKVYASWDGVNAHLPALYNGGYFRVQLYRGGKKVFDGHCGVDFDTALADLPAENYSMRRPRNKIKVTPGTKYTLKVCQYGKKSGVVYYGPWRSISFTTPKKGGKTYRTGKRVPIYGGY